MQVKLISITKPEITIERDGNQVELTPEELIVYTARVSSPQNQNNIETSEKLINYLIKHGHWSPFELVDMTVEIKTSRAIAQQIIRHRSFCLSGDTKLTFELPHFTRTKKRSVYHKTIKELYDRHKNGAKPFKRPGVNWKNIDKIKIEGIYNVPDLAKILDKQEEEIRSLVYTKRLNCIRIPTKGYKTGRMCFSGRDLLEFYNRSHNQFQTMKFDISKPSLRCYNVENKEFENTHIKSIWSNGIKDIYKLTTANGYSLKCTNDHPLLTSSGKYLSLETELGVKGPYDGFDASKEMFIATNGTEAYKSLEWMKQAKQKSLLDRKGVQGIAEEAGCSYHTIRKWLKLHKLGFTKWETASLRDVWNKGKTGYSFNRKPSSPEVLEKLRKARSGSASNFWRGGVSKERNLIQAYISQHRKSIYKKFNYMCGMCNKKFDGRIDLHHIIPVYEDITKAKDVDNIMPVHYECHMNHHGLSGDRKTWVEKRRTTKLSVVWSKIVKIEYVGKEEVFDLEVESSNHNFVANGIVVHNCFQEFSQRYAEVTDFEPVQLRKQAETNRQSSTEAFDPFIKEINDYSPEFHDLASDAIKKHISNSENLYKELIKAGAAKECARMVLPLTTQTRIYMKGSIRSWIHYLEARLSPHTQWEHREIAYQILKILSEKFPKVFNARFKNSTFMQDYNLFITDNS